MKTIKIFHLMTLLIFCINGMMNVKHTATQKSMPHQHIVK